VSATFILFSTTTGAFMQSFKVYFHHQYNPYYCIVKASSKEAARSQAHKEQGFIKISKVIKISK
tara:strand:+ start:217 stop:408 length:192 start_codon:yes stop_codon:yes gene_type:complete